MKIEQIEKLPSWEEQRKALKDAIMRGDEPIECNCIPYKEWILTASKTTVSTVYPAKPEDFHEYPVIMVFNEKLETWQAEPLVEYKNVCPVCLKLMLVRAIAGTSWLACCSKECYEKYNQVKGEKRRKTTASTYSCINCGFSHYDIFEVFDETGKCNNCQISAIEIKKIVASEKMEKIKIKIEIECWKDEMGNWRYTSDDLGILNGFCNQKLKEDIEALQN